MQFFAANTLHIKITKQWEEVPKSDYLELRNRILEVLIYPGTSKLITSRLCQVVSEIFTIEKKSLITIAKSNHVF